MFTKRKAGNKKRNKKDTSSRSEQRGIVVMFYFMNWIEFNKFSFFLFCKRPVKRFYFGKKSILDQNIT